MTQWIKDLFSESPRVSESRVMTMMICIVGCYVVIDGMLKTTVDYSGVATLAGALFTICMGGKIGSKFAEIADHRTGVTTKTTEFKDDAT